MFLPSGLKSHSLNLGLLNQEWSTIWIMTWLHFYRDNIPLNNSPLERGCHIACWLLFRESIAAWLQSFLLDWSPWWPKNSGKTEWYEREARICGARTEVSKRGKLDTPKWNQVTKNNNNNNNKTPQFLLDFVCTTFCISFSSPHMKSCDCLPVNNTYLHQWI